MSQVLYYPGTPGGHSNVMSLPNYIGVSGIYATPVNASQMSSKLDCLGASYPQDGRGPQSLENIKSPLTRDSPSHLSPKTTPF